MYTWERYIYTYIYIYKSTQINTYIYANSHLYLCVCSSSQWSLHLCFFSCDVRVRIPIALPSLSSAEIDHYYKFLSGVSDHGSLQKSGRPKYTNHARFENLLKDSYMQHSQTNDRATWQGAAPSQASRYFACWALHSVWCKNCQELVGGISTARLMMVDMAAISAMPKSLRSGRRGPDVPEVHWRSRNNSRFAPVPPGTFEPCSSTPPARLMLTALGRCAHVTSKATCQNRTH